MIGIVSPAGGAINGVTVQLGTPGPANLSNTVEMNSQIIQSLFDPLTATSALPNQVRDTTPLTNGTFGTLVLRRTYTNNSRDLTCSSAQRLALNSNSVSCAKTNTASFSTLKPHHNYRASDVTPSMTRGWRDIAHLYRLYFSGNTSAPLIFSTNAC